MMIFFEDTEVARSIPAKFASYLASLLDAGKSNRIVYFILYPVGALSCKPTPAPIFWEASSTLRIHQSALLGSTSCCGIYANTCSFIAKRGLYLIPNSLSSIAHRAILLDKLGLCIVLRKEDWSIR